MATLPLYLQDQTEEEIMQRMLNRVPLDIDKSEGSFIWDAQAPVAFVLAEAAIWAQQVLQRGFASTAFGEYLDLRVAEHGVIRRAAVAAHGIVRFTGTPGKAIPSGVGLATPADEISGESSIEYVTTAAVTLDGEGVGEAPIRAVEAGRTGNVPAGVITVMSTPISGIMAVANPEATTGGTDIESDESLLQRFYARVRNQGTSGNKAQYIQWAGEVPGVGAVQVQPLWQGPGTVGIYLLDADKRAANAEIVDAAQSYIDPTMDGQGEGMAPAGPIVTVMAAEEIPINISVQLTLASGASLAEVKTQIDNGVTAYLKQLAFADPLVRVTRIAAVLLDIPPIIDYANLTVNGASDTNIEINFGQVAVLGTVDVHE
ncbi:phage-like element PBSX protein XkdT [Paenibacillus antibioticophila]|uniref:Phage-like element PBSX protein XkdT n=1 Tax=Paenibacillus antibioticophila TaxID=1274374 RepID=A0A919XQQ1_9BACL|nr:baseplate J/gp47 family protein [Paenibacillus antibioticophila]GIO36194.1 phage-like element PBSX protein XkdT [Paenibacillus antibioticophila]